MEHPVSLCFGTLAGEGGNKEGVATKLESEGLEGGKKYKSRQGGLMEGRQKVRSTKKGDERTPEAKITSSVFFGVSLSFLRIRETQNFRCQQRPLSSRKRKPPGQSITRKARKERRRNNCEEKSGRDTFSPLYIVAGACSVCTFLSFPLSNSVSFPRCPHDSIARRRRALGK